LNFVGWMLIKFVHFALIATVNWVYERESIEKNDKYFLYCIRHITLLLGEEEKKNLIFRTHEVF